MTVQETTDFLRSMPMVLFYIATLGLFYAAIAYLRLRRWFHCIIGALLSATGLVLFELLGSAVKQFCRNEGIITAKTGNHSIIFYWAAAVFLLQLAAWLLYDCGSARRRKLTSQSIKDAYDHLSSGVCYWFANGKTILVNRKMARMTEQIFGERRYFGQGFWNLLEKGTLPQNVECLQSGQVPVIRLETVLCIVSAKQSLPSTAAP